MKLCLKKDCILHGSPRVKFDGDIKDVTIAFVGESPGREDERMKLPLIGEAGRILKEQASIAGLSEYNCFIANSAMCFIPKEDLKQKQINTILSTCRSHLEKALNVTKPKVIVTLGALAAKQIIKATSLAPIRGTFIWSEEFKCWVFPTFHPSYCLLKPSSLDLLAADLYRLKTFLRSGCELPAANGGEMSVEIRESIADILTSSSGVSYDTETQGLDYINPTNVMISYSIATSESQAYQVMLHELTSESDPEAFTIPWEIGKGKKKVWTALYVKRSSNFDLKLSELRQLFESNKIKKVMMNGNYDIHHTNALFKNAGQSLPELNNYTIDIQLLAHLVNENLYARSSLEQLRKSFTVISSQYDSEFNSGFDKSNMLSVPKDSLAVYAGADACVTYSAAKGLVRALNDDPEKERIQFYFKNMVMPVTTKVLYTLEQNGILVDMNELPNVKNELLQQQDYLYLKLMAAIPNSIKEKYRDKRSPEAPLTKTNMIREMLYTKEGLNIPMMKDKKKKETDSVDKKIRVELLSRKLSKKASEFISDYNQWTVLNTLLTRYVAGIEKAVRIDGRIHSSFSLGVAATGRSASSSINLQNIPKRGSLAKIIRKLFVAPPGYVLISADASQAELRFMALLAQEPTMLEIYREGGDIHGKTAEVVTGKKQSDFTPSEFKAARQKAKCFHPDVEVLTKEGWVALKNLRTDQEVMQAIPKDHEGITLEWALPTHLELRPNHEDSLSYLKSENINLKVTPDHRMLIQNNYGQFKVVMPDAFIKARSFWNAGISENGPITVPEDRIIQLMVAAQADGSISRDIIKFGFYKQRKISRLLSLLKDGEYKITQHKNGKNRPVTTVRLSVEVSSLLFKLLTHTKTFQWDLLNWPLEKRLLLLDELKYWDGGTVPRGKLTIYSSIIRQNCDVLQALGSISGRKSKVFEEVRDHYTSGRIYKLHMQLHAHSRGANGEKFSAFSHNSLPYTEDVAVISVPSTFLLVRNPIEDGTQIPVITGQSVNFGFLYGAGWRTFQRVAKIDYGVEVSDADAQQIRELFFDKYSAIKDYHRKVKSFCHQHKYVISPLGRVRHLPEIDSTDDKVVKDTERQALNHAIQSVASDSVLLSALEIMKVCPPEECTPVLFIHDDLTFQVREDLVDKYARIIKHHMINPPLEQFGVNLNLPLGSDTQVGRSLADMHDYEWKD